MPKMHPAVSGILGRCVDCGTGKLYSGYLKLAPRCTVCGCDFEKASAEDAPVTGILVLVGGIGMAGVIFSVVATSLPTWAILAIWFAVVIVLSVAILPPLKGALIGMQHHYKAAQHIAKTLEEEH